MRIVAAERPRPLKPRQGASIYHSMVRRDEAASRLIEPSTINRNIVAINSLDGITSRG
jgi:hypothetical protein